VISISQALEQPGDDAGVERCQIRAIEVDFSPEADNINLGPAPSLQWIKIESLVVDDRYQRPLKRAGWSQIKKIADNFSWSMFSAVFVSPIEGGKYAIVDGQHRTHAALACGGDSVPCLIVNIDFADQARAFAAVNGMVVKVHPLHIFHASIAAGNEDAVRLNDLVNSCGFKIMRTNTSSYAKKFGELYAITILKDIVSAFGDDILAATLLAIKHAEVCTCHLDHHPAIVWAIASCFGKNRDLCATPTIISDRIDDNDLSLELYLEQAREEAKVARRRGFSISTKNHLVKIMEKELFACVSEVRK